MKKNIFFFAAVVFLAGCKNTDIPVQQPDNAVIENENQNAIVRTKGYSEGQNGNIFVVYISDELKEKKEIVSTLTDSEFCKDWVQQYTLQATVKLEEEQICDDWIVWADKEKNTRLKEQ